MNRIYLIILFIFCSGVVSAQQYTGMTGLLHTPSAEMNPVATARIGTHYINRLMMPAAMPYNSWSHYLSVTPYKWVEVGFTGILFNNRIEKDRHFSIKLRPITEKKYIPSIVIGADDPIGSSFDINLSASMFYTNYYIATSKHFQLKQFKLGLHLAYRYYPKEYNSHISGITGGVTLTHTAIKNLRFVADYGSNMVNVGADYYICNLILLQLSCTDFRHISGGIALQIRL